MAQCPMPTPIANHKYYGGCYYKTDSGLTSADARFEWFIGDGANKQIVFGQKTDTGNTWKKMSAIGSLSSPVTGNWIIRNFLVNPTGYCYCTKMMVVDLTDTFGAGNEPTKEWCDENILEWSKFYRQPFTAPCTSANYNTVYTCSNFQIAGQNGYLSTDYNYEVRDFWYYLVGNTSAAEAYVNSTANRLIDTTQKYYGFIDVSFSSYSSYNNLSMDIYYPVAEPLLGQTPLVDHQSYNGGGGMKSWKRVSMLRDRSSFASGSYPQRFDFNNQRTNANIRITNFGIISLYTLHFSSTSFTGTNGWTHPSNYNDVYTKAFMDRRYGGYLMGIIHIPDPKNKQIKFNTNYDIVCNDIIPDPGNNKVWFDTNGRIHCKTIITDKAY